MLPANAIDPSARPCHACGYDLRAAPPQSDDVVRCPECGQTADASAQQWRDEAGDNGMAAQLRKGAAFVLFGYACIGLATGIAVAINNLPASLDPDRIERLIYPWANLGCLMAAFTCGLRAALCFRGAAGPSSRAGTVPVACLYAALLAGVAASVLIVLIDSFGYEPPFPVQYAGVPIGGTLFLGGVIGAILTLWTCFAALRRVPPTPLRTAIGVAALWASGIVALLLPCALWIAHGLLTQGEAFPGPPMPILWLMVLGALGLVLDAIAVCFVMFWLLFWSSRRQRLADAAAFAFGEAPYGDST